MMKRYLLLLVFSILLSGCEIPIFISDPPGTYFSSWEDYLDGLYFPQASYSRLRFDVDTSAGSNSIHIKIVQVDDIYSRYLTVFLDGWVIYTDAIGSSGFHDYVPFDATPGSHKLEIQIDYGGYKKYGWKLEELRITSGDIDAIYFPRENLSQLIFDAEMGTNSWMELDIQQEDDVYLRSFSAYVDDVTVIPESSEHYLPWSYSEEFDLGDYYDGSLHKLALQVRYGGYTEWGWKLMLKPADELGVTYSIVK